MTFPKSQWEGSTALQSPPIYLWASVEVLLTPAVSTPFICGPVWRCYPLLGLGGAGEGPFTLANHS